MGYLTKANNSFLKLTGYNEEELIGKHISELTPYEEGVYDSLPSMAAVKQMKSDLFGGEMGDDETESTAVSPPFMTFITSPTIDCDVFVPALFPIDVIFDASLLTPHRTHCLFPRPPSD